MQKAICQKRDSNPRTRCVLQPECSALDHSAILTDASISLKPLYITTFTMNFFSLSNYISFPTKSSCKIKINLICFKVLFLVCLCFEIVILRSDQFNNFPSSILI